MYLDIHSMNSHFPSHIRLLNDVIPGDELSAIDLWRKVSDGWESIKTKRNPEVLELTDRVQGVAVSIARGWQEVRHSLWERLMGRNVPTNVLSTIIPLSRANA